MTFNIKELDFQSTPLGDISLRMRAEPRLNGKILYEVKLGDEFLMSSLFTEAEIQLSKLALLELEGDKLEIIVGGLGLGYTAAAALEDDQVTSLTVIDVMQPVIDWHNNCLVPLGETLSQDPRCELRLGDFFAIATQSDCGFYPEQPDRLVDAILLDIDHSPSHWLNEENSQFYTEASLQAMADKLKPGGLFGLWSNDPPDKSFEDLLGSVFNSISSHIVSFPNPFREQESTNSVYLAKL
ncbi:MAG: spermidine synthase [Saprospiraceae bacterium]|jgi:spermidine synthase